MNDLKQQGTRRQRPVIAIDGPAGAGKSTVAAHLARCFGFLNLETGAMYRALALKALDQGLDVDNEAAMTALCAETTIGLEPAPKGNRVLLDGVEILGRLRDPGVTDAASRVSVHPEVRRSMVDRQRAMGAAGGVVMEGRDIGTAVFPDAEVKIFLDARPEVRGQRRFKQVAAAVRRQPAAAAEAEAGVALTPAAVLAELEARDERDRERADSPLRSAEDALHIDSTVLTLDQVKAESEAIVRRWIDRNGTR